MLNFFFVLIITKLSKNNINYLQTTIYFTNSIKKELNSVLILFRINNHDKQNFTWWR